MKTVKVVAAVIEDNGNILATQRGYGDFKGGWEFPGGKIEKGETPQEALKREIYEELNIEILVNHLIDKAEYTYKSKDLNFQLLIYFFWCKIIGGDLTLKEHQDARWLSKDTIRDVHWLPADMELVKKIETSL